MVTSEAEPRSFEAGRGILDDRRAAIGIFAFCLYASVTSWRAATRGIHVSHHDFYYLGRHFSHDPIYIFALAFSIFVLVNITLRSPLRADRFVFGAGAFSFALSAITQLASLTAFSIWTIRAAQALIWSITAAVCAAVLAVRSRHRHRHRPSFSSE